MSTTEETITWQQAGNHRLRNLDGISVVECHGEIYTGDARLMTTFFDEVFAKREIFLLLLLLAGSSRPGPEARKHLVDWTGNRKGATACVGAPMTFHVVASLLNRAVRLIHGNAMPMEMFKDQAEAIAWLREHERKLTGRE